MDHTRVNRDFYIKVYGQYKSNHKSKLQSSRQAEEIIEDPNLYEKLVQRAYDKGLDKVVCKLRRGLTIIFYGK